MSGRGGEHGADKEDDKGRRGGGGEASSSDKEGKNKKRDTSPSAASAASHSSGLEWDPSADVGTPTSGPDSIIFVQVEHKFNEGKNPPPPEGYEDIPSRNMGAQTTTRSLLGGNAPSSTTDARDEQQKLDAIKKTSPPEGYEDIVCRNIGVQTSSSLGNASSSAAADARVDDEQPTEYSSIYHSTPTDRPLSAPFLFHKPEKRPQRKYEDSLNQQQQPYDDDDENKKKKKQDRRRERSPPQPFAVASRKSSHSHHYANHSRNHDPDFSSHMENKSREGRPKVKTSSSSDLSPPCFLINKIANTNKSPIKEGALVSAIESHRDYHVKKVRHELKQLEKLNQLLSKNLESKRHHRHHPQKSSSSETEAPNNKVPHHSKANPKPSSSRNKSPQKKDSPRPSSSTSSTSSGPPRKPSVPTKSSLLGIDNLLKDIKQSTRNSSSKGQKDSALEKKLDELMDAFSFIAGMLLEKDKDCEDKKKEEESSSAKEKKKPTTPKRKQQQQHQQRNVICPCKPPVAYFIPFQNCQGQYTFRRVDIEGMGGRQPVINTASRTVSRQQEDGGPVEEDNDDSSWEDAADEDAENRDPAKKQEEEEEISYRKAENRFNLQAMFEQRCPNFISRLRDREAVLSRIKSEREIRAEKKREWIRLYGKSPDNLDLEELDAMLPPKGPRLMTTKEMREITKRHYKNLPEVQEKVIQRKAEEEKKTNRIMSQVFAQQLRKGVLKGEVNHVHSRSLLRR